MTENHFIDELRAALGPLPAAERDDIILDLREYFSEARQDGKTDAEIAHSLGTPSKIANELLEAYSTEKEEPEITTKTIPSDNEVITLTDSNFSNVKMNIQHGALIVRPSDIPVTTVELTGKNEKLELHAEVVGDTLVIQLKGLRHWLFMFTFSMHPVTVQVTLPKKVYDSLQMKTDNGRIDVAQLFSKKITAESANGRIKLNEIGATTITTETDNGRIEVEKVQTDHLRAKTDNGRIEIHHVDAESIEASSDNGRIVFNNVSGSINGVTDNGRITLDTISLNRNINLRTDNGTILLESMEEPTNVSIHAKTGHGKIDIFGESNTRTVFGAGEHTIRLKSGNGRITVK